MGVTRTFRNTEKDALKGLRWTRLRCSQRREGLCIAFMQCFEAVSSRRARLPPPRACPLHRSVLTQICVRRRRPPSLARRPARRTSNLTHFDAPLRHSLQRCGVVLVSTKKKAQAAEYGLHKRRSIWQEAYCSAPLPRRMNGHIQLPTIPHSVVGIEILKIIKGQCECRIRRDGTHRIVPVS